MSEQEIVDVLSVHADSLKDGVDLTDELLASKPAEEGRELKPLLLLARQIKEALAPVAPRPGFISALKVDLRAQVRQVAGEAAAGGNADKRKWIGLAAGLGALVYFVGLTWVSVRWSLAVLSFLAGLVGLKSVRQASIKARLMQ